MSSDWSSCVANWTSPSSHYTDEYNQNYVNTIGTNIILMLGVVFLFWLLQRCKVVRHCYDVRRSARCFDDVNVLCGADEYRQFFPPGDWLRNLGWEMQRHMGLDGLVTFRFAVLCLRFCQAYLVIAVGLLLFYWTRPSKRGYHPLSMDALSEDRPEEVVVPIAAAYVMAVILMAMLNHEYKNFVILRQWFHCPPEGLNEFGEDELDRREVIHRSVLLDRLPPEIRTDKQLLEFCNSIFDEGAVVRAKLCVDTTALQRAVTSYEHLAKDIDALRCSGGLLGVLSRFGPDRLLRRSRVLSHRCFRDPNEAIRDVRAVVEKLLKEHKNPSTATDESVPSLEPSPSNPHMKPEPVGLRSSFWFVSGTLWMAAKGIFKTSRAGSTGLVTFKNRQLQTVALCVPLQQSTRGVEAHCAPFPKDLIWHNIGIVSVEEQSRAATSFTLAVLAVLLWSSIATFIQAFAQIDRIASCLRLILPHFISSRLDTNALRNFGWWEALNHEISAISLVLLLVVLPLFTRLWAEHYCHIKCRSQVSLFSLRRCFVYTFVTLYVTAFSGSFFSSARSGVIDSTMHVAKTIAAGLGSVDHYFMVYIITKIGIRLGVYLLRLNVVFPWSLWRLGNHICQFTVRQYEKTCEPPGMTEPLQKTSSAVRENKSLLGDETAENILVESPFYDWILVDLSVTLSLTLLYGVMSPQMVFVGILFFGSYAAMIRYNFLFVYVQEYDSGGEFFFTLINFAYFSLATSLLMVHTHMTAVMSYWKLSNPTTLSTSCAWIAAVAIPILIIVVVAVWIFNHNRFKQVCSTLSLQQAKTYDKTAKDQTKMESMEELFEDPSVIEARKICTQLVPPLSGGQC
uniref:CSC1/OSCA1-like 7TM region domain-containing protein n=1 Tax=Noctiluca scintillans TaxID=2966 RepID=A0A7S1AB09_NOCSC|mmetsp:Transcript_38904/g.103368  ORF Transcript_38904/g.103368 Transcript_38904/m.103368 type:complete len:849 (+) Transcript_38904:92-2638(+)